MTWTSQSLEFTCSGEWVSLPLRGRTMMASGWLSGVLGTLSKEQKCGFRLRGKVVHWPLDEKKLCWQRKPSLYQLGKRRHNGSEEP
eukprot:scaffold21165_cov21-Tisochrysis_lutea.AAC.1